VFLDHINEPQPQKPIFYHHKRKTKKHMRSRPLGAILIILGIVMMAYTGFNFVTREKVVDIGPLEIEKKQNNPVRWSPIVGLVLLIGGVVVLVSSKGTANSG